MNKTLFYSPEARNPDWGDKLGTRDRLRRSGENTCPRQTQAVSRPCWVLRVPVAWGSRTRSGAAGGVSLVEGTLVLGPEAPVGCEGLRGGEG